MIREHIGRGIWRCLYDPDSSLVTAGFDSALKAQQLHASVFERHAEEVKDSETEQRSSLFVFHVHQSILVSWTAKLNMSCAWISHLKIPYLSPQTMIICTMLNYPTWEVKWIRDSEAVPIVFMDFLFESSPDHPSSNEDWVTVGDGKGHMTIVSLTGHVHSLNVGVTFTWSAGLWRQLLGT